MLEYLHDLARSFPARTFFLLLTFLVRDNSLVFSVHFDKRTVLQTCRFLLVLTCFHGPRFQG